MDKDSEKKLYEYDIKAIKRLNMSAQQEKKHLKIAERRYKQVLENLAKHHA